MSLKLNYRPDIDGLRAVAVISVIIFHFYSNALPGGFVGVDIFFVISGFLITQIILAKHEQQSFSFVDFYIRRIRRIFPALFTMLFGSLLIAFFVLPTGDMVWFLRSLHYASFQISNLFFQRSVDYFDKGRDEGALLHTWSLGVEEQFYLLMPLLIFLLLKVKNKKDLPFYGLFALSLVSLAVSQYLVFFNQKLAFFSLPSRFFELGIGCLLAFGKIKKFQSKTNQAISVFGFLIVLLSLFFIRSDSFPGLWALAPCLGAAMIIFAGDAGDKNFISKILSQKPCVFIGKISYSLYLWHLPLFYFYKEYSNKSQLTLESSSLLLVTLFLISFLSWKFVETPFRKSFSAAKNRSKFLHPFSVAAALIVAFATLSSFAKSSEGFRFRMAQSSLINKNGLDQYASFEKGKLCGVGKKSHQFAQIDDCVIGENKNFEVVIFGDSHAGHYSPSITAWAQQNGLSIASFYLFSCPPFLTENSDDKDEKCHAYRKKIWEILQTKTHIKYVFLASSWYAIEPQNQKAEEEFIKSFKDTISRISALNKKIIIMGRVPDFVVENGLTPLKCIEQSLTPIRKILPPPNQNCLERELSFFADQLREEELMKAAIKPYKNIKFFDAFPYFCRDEKCSAVQNDVLLYADHGHLNSNGAEYLGELNPDLF